MNVVGKLGMFTLALATAFGVAYGIGNAAGPTGSDDTTAAAGDDTAGSGHGTGAHSDDANGKATAHLPAGGLLVSQDGYQLELLSPDVQAHRTTDLSFRVTGPDGEPVTTFDISHDQRMHLIVVRRDLTGFQHLHPTMDDDGTWHLPVTFTTAGTYRAFADFVPSGAEPLTLGIDVPVTGEFTPTPLPEPATTTTVDGYTVELGGELVAGETSKLTLTISKNGEPVTDVQPYLGAYGHLVALRSGDLAYLHVHPEGHQGDGSTRPGPQITFFAEVPSAGDYRLYLDFQHDDVVRTAEFTARAHR